MSEYEVNNLDSIGLIQDVAAYQLPPEAFTTALNGRFNKDGFGAGPGWEQAFTPSVAPYFVWGLKSPQLEDWVLYASLAKVYAFDGTVHSDITRAVGGDYAATFARDFNATILGGVPILNNGIDDPQFWSAYSGGQQLQDLTNWPAATSTRTIRAFGPNLVAFDVTKSGVQYGSMVKWSHPADPGGIPISWDEADPTLDAGETDITDEHGGPILDALQLHDMMMIYRLNSTTIMRRVAGQFIFQFDTFLTQFGTLAKRCVATTGDGNYHFVAGSDDIVIHNGDQVKSVVDRRMRRTIFNAIDVSNYRNSFMFNVPREREMWFCFPETGHTQPNRAIVWGYGAGGETGVLYEQDVSFQSATVADLAAASSDWDSDSDVWDSDPSTWDQSDRRQVLLADPENTKVFKMNDTAFRDGVAYSTVLARQDQAMLARRATGELVNNFRERKFVRRIWIKASGEPFNVRIGIKEFPEDSVTWVTSELFTPGTDDYVDFLASASSVSLEFSSTGQFRINGYVIEYTKSGRFP